MDFQSQLDNRKNIIESELKNYLTVKYPEKIYESMSYSVSAGGKRLRPILLVSTCAAFSGSITEALPFACALELIHTYSLIHDDLPAMDNDDFRRGSPTNHKIYGEAMAILAGDGLLNMAYEIMSAACIKNFSKKNLMAMNEIANSAGALGMVGGQAVDLLSENKIIGTDTLIYIHRHKTAALIRSALMAGGLVGGASEAKLALLSAAGLKMGLAFQIKDDILDVTGDDGQLGKPTHSDEKNFKSTYISIFGLEKAEEDYSRLSSEATALFKEIGCEFLSEYAESVIYREM